MVQIIIIKAINNMVKLNLLSIIEALLSPCNLNNGALKEILSESSKLAESITIPIEFAIVLLISRLLFFDDNDEYSVNTLSVDVLLHSSVFSRRVIPVKCVLYDIKVSSFIIPTIVYSHSFCGINIFLLGESFLGESSISLGSCIFPRGNFILLFMFIFFPINFRESFSTNIS